MNEARCRKCKREPECQAVWKGKEPMVCVCFTKIKTNGDRLREMTDEELATWLNCMQSNAYHGGEYGRTNDAYPWNNEAWLKWLEQEADDEQNPL